VTTARLDGGGGSCDDRLRFSRPRRAPVQPAPRGAAARAAHPRATLGADSWSPRSCARRSSSRTRAPRRRSGPREDERDALRRGPPPAPRRLPAGQTGCSPACTTRRWAASSRCCTRGPTRRGRSSASRTTPRCRARRCTSASSTSSASRRCSTSRSGACRSPRGSSGTRSRRFSRSPSPSVRERSRLLAGFKRAVGVAPGMALGSRIRRAIRRVVIYPGPASRSPDDRSSLSDVRPYVGLRRCPCVSVGRAPGAHLPSRGNLRRRQKEPDDGSHHAHGARGTSWFHRSTSRSGSPNRDRTTKTASSPAGAGPPQASEVVLSQSPARTTRRRTLASGRGQGVAMNARKLVLMIAVLSLAGSLASAGEISGRSSRGLLRW